MAIIFFLTLTFLTLAALSVVLVPLLKKRFLKTSLSIAFIFPLLAASIYWKIGSSLALLNAWEYQKAAQKARNLLATIKAPQQIIDLLKAHLKKMPKSAQGWYLLGKLYLEEKKYQLSVAAFEKAYTLEPNNTQYALFYAQADFYCHHQRLSDRGVELLHQILAKGHNNISALNLLAADAYMQKQYRKAIRLWEQLIPLFPSGSQDQRAVLSMIHQAESEMEHKAH